MNVHLDKAGWEKNFKGWIITDCATRGDGMISLCARKVIPHEKASLMWDYDIPTRLVNIDLKNPGADNWGHQEVEGFNIPVLGISRAPFPVPQGLIASKNKNGDVFPRGSGVNGPMEFIHVGGEPFPNRLKCINGYTWCVSSARRIYKRVAVGKWVPMNQGFPNVPRSSSLGFDDMDAFAENDMYAVGGDGDVWHFNGTVWRQMGFPSNVQLGTVTCAGDGKVYISGEGGSLWVGRESTWKKIYTGGSSILWNDVLWFNGQLWLASDYQFMVWNGKKMEGVSHDGKPVFMNGHMDACNGELLIAGSDVVMTFDGRQWKKIVAPYL